MKVSIKYTLSTLYLCSESFLKLHMIYYWFNLTVTIHLPVDERIVNSVPHKNL